MRLYNSLTEEKDEFVPINKNKVLMYVCGITPYDTTHLGHAFTYVFFDTLSRYLKYKGTEVIYTQNVTDIDNDILKRAKEKNENWCKLGDFWTNRFLEDMKSLNILPPTYYVKATDSIEKMIEIIKVLLDKKFAYINQGRIYFDVKKFKDFGKLSKLSYDLMIKFAKDRGGEPDDPLKKNPLDFLLWQKSKDDEPFWESPWGKGRPGWHIECSAMINRYLGDQTDIHGGGIDIQFPHHECEIAQSESYTGKKPFVKYWIHTGTVMFQGEKMAKSLGNLIMVSELLKDFSPNSIRFTLLSHHYRSPWEYKRKELTASEKIFNLINKAIKDSSIAEAKENNKYMKKLFSFLEDDMDTPNGLLYVEKLVENIIERNKEININECKEAVKTFLTIIGFVF